MFLAYEFNRTLKEILGQEYSLNQEAQDVYSNLILREYSNEALQIMINESIGLEILIPFTLDILEENILAQGIDGYGDLLNSLSCLTSYWDNHTDEKSRLTQLIQDNINSLESILAILLKRNI